MPVWPALFAFAHHLAAFTVVAMLVIEHTLFAASLPVPLLRKLLRIDLIYGSAAAVLLVVGALRVLYFEKGPIYYFSNGWFIAKLALFALVGLVSIYPTMTFLSWRPALREQRAPQITALQARRVHLCLRIELAGILGILLAAALMARGFGHIG